MLQYVFGLFRSEKPFEPRVYPDEVEQKYSNGSVIPEHHYEGEESSHDPDILLSLCGHLIKPSMTDHELKSVFYANRVLESAFKEDPLSVINNGSLMVQIGSTIYNWETGLAVIISELAFGRVLKPMVDKLTEARKGLFWSKKSGLKIDFKSDTDSDTRTSITRR